MSNFQQLGQLGFSPINLEGSEFDRAELVRLGGDPSSDGAIHSLTYQFQHPILGIVFLTEYSFLTDPDVTRLRVREASGNILVNGKPATLAPVKYKKAGGGATTVRFYTDTKLFSIHVFDTITRDHEKFDKLNALAQALH
ncbi:hypothetical protein [Microbulbifer sp. M83]|uniref:hypothetical protein n=1 Tax=Microbulbifer sp. M83 TaxID=3118246 RepID=UPI002FE28AD8